jgi:hypothetical protein
VCKIFPTIPGSLIRATAADWTTPALFMLADGVLASEEYDVTSAWICSHKAGKYSQSDLTLVEVVHDEGRAQMLRTLPGWGDLTDIDRGAALLYASAVSNEGHEYACENYPARFRDHPILTQLRPHETCAYVDSLGIDLNDSAAVLIGSATVLIGADESSLSWDEYRRLYDLAMDTD